MNPKPSNQKAKPEAQPVEGGMNTEPKSQQAKPRVQLDELAKAIGAILGVPLALFAVVHSIIAQPVTSLIVALITAVLVSVWVILSRWVSITQIITAWLALAVVVLAGFVIWPRRMTVKGFVYDMAHNPINNENVRLFDYSGKIYETQTDAEGYYQFFDVPCGKYKMQVRTSAIEGETKGFLVRVVQQNLTVPEILATASPTRVAAVTPNTPTATPVVSTYTPSLPPTLTLTPTLTATPTNTPTLTSTLTAIPTNTPTPTSTPAIPDAVTVAYVNLRSGPGTVYDVINTLSPDQVLTVTGRNNDATWLQVNTDQVQKGWVVNWADFVTLNLPTERIPIVPTPPPPTPSLTPTATPTPTPMSFQNFEPDNGTPDDYCREVWFAKCSFESTVVREGGRAVRVHAHAEAGGAGNGGTVGIYPSSSDPIDLSSATTLSVWVYDTQGNNDVELKLRDYNDALSNKVWSEMHAEHNNWTEITWSLSDFTGVDLNQIKNIELYEWWDGVYYFDAVSWE